VADARTLLAQRQTSTAGDLHAFYAYIPLEVPLNVPPRTIYFTCTVYEPACLLLTSRDLSPASTPALTLTQLGHETFSRGRILTNVNVVQGSATIEASHWHDFANSRVYVLKLPEFRFLTFRAAAFICKNVALIFAECAKVPPIWPAATPAEHSRKPSTDSHRCISCGSAHQCASGTVFSHPNECQILIIMQSLYYYSLAGSSIHDESEQLKGDRKSRLRCYQPPQQPTTAAYASLPSSYVPVVQSASVSPHETHLGISARQPSLPHLHDAIWARKLSLAGTGTPHVCTQTKRASPADRDRSLQLPPLRENRCGVVPSAPFANAGPPGVHFYATTPMRGSPVYLSPYAWTYGR